MSIYIAHRRQIWDPNFFWDAPLAQTPANFGTKRRFLVS